MAVNGLGAGSVTAEDIVLDTQTKAEMDKEAIRYNADAMIKETQTQARNQAWDLRSQSKLNLFAGKNAKRAGEINAASSLLGSASSTARLYV